MVTSETDCVKSYDQLLSGHVTTRGEDTRDCARESYVPRDYEQDTETQRMMDSTSGSGVHQSEV